MIRRYRHSGVGIASELDLPQWDRFYDNVDGTPDVAIEWAERPLPPCRSDNGLVEGTAQAVRFEVAGVGRWLIVDGRRIVVEPWCSTATPELRLFTLGSAWAALGYQRGWQMCHGSAVLPAGSEDAVLLTGAAGQGKSTLAAAMGDEGAVVLSDDLCRVEVAVGKALLHPSAGQVKLWNGAVDQLGWAERVTGRDHARSDKVLCRLPDVARTPHRLRAVVVLDWGEALALNRLRGAEAVGAVGAATCFRPQTLDVLDGWMGQTRQLLRLLQHVPAFRLTRPHGFDLLPPTCRLLAGLL